MQEAITAPEDYYDKDADLKKAVDFIVSDEMMKLLDAKENLERLYNELLNKDWFMTFPDFRGLLQDKREGLRRL